MASPKSSFVPDFASRLRWVICSFACCPPPALCFVVGSVSDAPQRRVTVSGKIIRHFHCALCPVLAGDFPANLQLSIMAASGAGAQTGNTVFLEPQNRIVEDFVTKFFSEDAPTKDTHMVVGDFDGKAPGEGGRRLLAIDHAKLRLPASAALFNARRHNNHTEYQQRCPECGYRRSACSLCEGDPRVRAAGYAAVDAIRAPSSALHSPACVRTGICLHEWKCPMCCFIAIYALSCPVFSAGVFGPAQAALGAHLQPASDPSTVSLSLNRDELTGDAAAVISAAARIKREVVGAPFQFLLEQLLAGTITQAKPFAVHLRSSEIVYFCPGADRVTVGFGLHFPDATDAAVVRIVCSQFAEVQRTIGTAPTVNFCEAGTGATIPREITSSGLPLLAEGTEGFTGYLTLSYFPSHADSAEKMENTVTLVSSFRTYLNYHLKAAKSYIHSRMRNRVTSLLQVLERAKTSDPTVKKVKKTFQGKAIRKTA